MRSPTLDSNPDPSLAELAAQIGLDDLTPVEAPPPMAEAGDLSRQEDVEPELQTSPETFTTQPAFYNTGFSKAALVGGVGLVLFLGGASIFKVASPTGQTRATPPETPTLEPQEDPTLTALRQSQIAESKAKAKLALLAQTPAQEATQAPSPDPATARQTPKTPATGKPIAQAQPTPIVPPAPAPPTRINPAPTYSTVTPQPRPVTPRATPTANRPWTAPRAAAPPAPKPVDAMAEWQRLAALGTYGNVVPRGESPSTGGVDANATVAALFSNSHGPLQAAPPASATVEASDWAEPPAAVGTAFQAAPLSDYFDARLQPVAQWHSVEREQPLEPDGAIKAFAKPHRLAQTPQRTILVGSSGQGHLVTPVLWAPDGARGEARFIVALSEPITDAQGQPALPKDTQFVVTAQNLDPESGLVDLTVMALVIDGQEYEAPEGIFSVRDRQGGLLLGELRNQPNQGRGDFTRIATGALAQVGQLMNRPRSTSTSTTHDRFGSSQSSTVQNDAPNYVGAVLQGGFEELASVIEERQQAAAEALAQAPQLYQLPANYPIRIFVNQSLSL